jgi:hypothetical protein
MLRGKTPVASAEHAAGVLLFSGPFIPAAGWRAAGDRVPPRSGLSGDPKHTAMDTFRAQLVTYGNMLSSKSASRAHSASKRS